MNPVNFISESLAEESGFTPAKFQMMLDEILAAGARDPVVQIIFLLRKGDVVALVGVGGGKQIEREEEFREILTPIINRL